LSGLTRVEGQLQLAFANSFAPTTLSGLDSLTHVGSLYVDGDIRN
jgi:hypothetical protein